MIYNLTLQGMALWAGFSRYKNKILASLKTRNKKQADCLHYSYQKYFMKTWVPLFFKLERSTESWILTQDGETSQAVACDDWSSSEVKRIGKPLIMQWPLPL